MQRPVARTNKTIFLDIDQTLLCTSDLPVSWYMENIKNKPENYHIQVRSFVISIPHRGTKWEAWGTYRPHMKEFLMFCFWYFKRVIIWSAGGHSYVHALVDKLFKDLPEPDMILTAEHTDKLDGASLKSLPRLLAQIRKNLGTAHDFTIENIYFIDDLIHNFRHNPENGIVIPPYDPTHENLCPRDTALSDLCMWLDQPHIQQADDVRMLDKSQIFIKSQ